MPSFETPLPLVSIVTPSLNQSRFIEETILSVLHQDYPKLEYIVVDGGSTDGTLEILRKYEGRLNWISEKDSGQSEAINKGFRIAHGEIVAWLNSDDTYVPGAISKAVQYLVDHPKVMMIYGEGYLLDEKGHNRGRFQATEPFNLWRLINYGDYILQQTTFIRLEILDMVGLLDESLHYGMDWDLWIRIGKKGRVHYIPEFLGNLREYPAAKSFSGGMARFRELVHIMRRHGNRRFPMAYFRYGWEPFQEAIIQRISRSLGGANLSWLSNLAWYLRKVLFYLYFKKLTRLSYPCQFPDGWISDHAFLAIPSKGQKLINLVGSTEIVPLDMLPLRIRIKSQGSTLLRLLITRQQKFEMHISLPERVPPGQFCELEIISRGYVCEDGQPFINGCRRSFQLL